MKIKKYIIGIIIILALIFLILISQGNIGISKNNMENNARKDQKIQENWMTASSINDDLGAFLFYDEDLSHSTFSIYIKRDGISFGYFFRYGGGVPGISENICRFKSDGKGSIFLSLNKIKVAKIEIDNGLQPSEVIPIDSNKPFSIIIPENVGEIRIYDVYGELIPVEDIRTDNI